MVKNRSKTLRRPLQKHIKMFGFIFKHSFSWSTQWIICPLYARQPEVPARSVFAVLLFFRNFGRAPYPDTSAPFFFGASPKHFSVWLEL